MIKLGYLKEKNPYDVEDELLTSLTHINLSFAKVVDIDGTVTFEVLDKPKLSKFIADNPQIKFSIAIGGWNAGNFSEAASSEETRKRFVDTTLNIVEEFNLDGVDLDWEYPCSSASGISSSPEDKRNFTLLMKALRLGLNELEENYGKKYLLTFAAGASESLVSNIETEELYKIVDFMNLMTYDMGGSFGVAGHHASLYPSAACEKKGGAHFVDLYDAAGFKMDKIVFGCAFYGRGGDNVAGINCEYKGKQGLYFDYHDVLKLIDDGQTTLYYDNDAKGAYTYDGFTFITIETTDSIKEKMKYVNSNGLAGIMFWEYATDNTGTLLDIIINYQP